MSDHQESSSGRLRTDVPNSARVWNYLLGGKDNHPADADAGEIILRAVPDIARIARDQRAFLVRAVRFLTAEAGIRQFLDIGGLPTVDGTHEAALRTALEYRPPSHARSGVGREP